MSGVGSLSVGLWRPGPGSVLVTAGRGGAMLLETFQPGPHCLHIPGGQAPAGPAQAGAAQSQGDGAVGQGVVHD